MNLCPRKEKKHLSFCIKCVNLPVPLWLWFDYVKQTPLSFEKLVNGELFWRFLNVFKNPEVFKCVAAMVGPECK